MPLALIPFQYVSVQYDLKILELQQQSSYFGMSKGLMRKSVRQQIKIIEAIVSAREEAHISRMELSSKLGGSSTLMQKIETGDRDLKVWEFIAIARELDIDPCELLRRALVK